jgi:hypothetical protein
VRDALHRTARLNEELDPLLDRLRRERISPLALEDVESLVWERIDARDRRARSRRSQIPLQVAAVVVAFGIGILFGVQGRPPSAGMQAAFVEELESVPAGGSSLLL